MAFLVFATLVAAAVGSAGGMLARQGGDRLPFSALIILFALLMGLVLLAAVPAWRTLDERQKGARLTSWYWGGSFGGGVGILTALALDSTPPTPMLWGAVLVFGAQAVSFLVAWGAWSVFHRPDGG